MVKGIHKKIIEINHPDSAYFEKAVFYLRPTAVPLPPTLAKAAAKECLTQIEPQPKSARWKRWLPIGISAVVSCGITVLTIAILH